MVSIIFALTSSQVISVENPGIRLKLFLRELSKQSGLEFGCSIDLENEVLAASFKNQSIDLVKTQLSRVVHASWTNRDGLLWISQTEEEKKAERLEHREIRRKQIQNRLDSLKSYIPKHSLTTDDVNDYMQYLKGRYEGGFFHSQSGEGIPKTLEEVSRSKPIFRLAARLSTLIKPDSFNLDGFDTKLTMWHSNSSLNGLIPLPIDYQETLSRFEEETEAFRPASLDPSSVMFLPMHLVVANNFESVAVFDRNWKRIDNVGISPTPSPASAAKQEYFTISPETIEGINAGFSTHEFESMKQIPAIQKVWEVLRRPDLEDPLGIVYGRLWLDFARFLDKPVLVSIPDSITELDPLFKFKSKMHEFIRDGYDRIDADNWLLARPLDPLEARVRRLDRSLIRHYADLTLSRRSHSLDESAENGAIGLSVILRNQIWIGSQYFPTIYRQSNLLPVYGNLSRAIRSKIRSGISIPVTSLSQDAIDAIRFLRDLDYLYSISDKDSAGGTNPYFPLSVIPNDFANMLFEANLSTDIVFKVKGNHPDIELSLDYLKLELKRLAASEVTHHFDGLLLQYAECKRLNMRLRIGRKTFEDHISEEPAQFSQPILWENLPADIKDQILPTGSTEPARFRLE